MLNLDQEQMKVAQTKERFVMVLAGAGAGKTTTLVGRVSYLLKELNVPAHEILILSFTNQAVLELQERIEKICQQRIDVMTFHKLGFRIVKQYQPTIRFSNEKYQIIHLFVQKCLDNDQFHVASLLAKYMVSFPKSLKVKMEKVVGYVHKYEDLLISNYLYLYEIPFTYLEKGMFVLSIRNQTYFLVVATGDETLFGKLLLGKKMWKHTKGISVEVVELQKEKILESMNLFFTRKGIFWGTQFPEKVFASTAYQMFVTKCQSVLSQYKGKRINENWINQFCLNGSDDLRKFLLFIQKMYKFYQSYLHEHQQLDFDDMIDQSIDLIRTKKVVLPYRYIIVDEYQDISENRFELIRHLVSQNNSSLLVVGDDYQSIYAFSGSNVQLFLSYQLLYPGAKLYTLKNTYRNSQELISICETFIMKNPKQMPKKLISKKRLLNPIEIMYYRNNLPKKVYECIKKINVIGTENKEILLLGRYRSDQKELLHQRYFYEQNGVIQSRQFPHLKITFLTIHSAKGLGFDFVILLNNKDEIKGFPSQIPYDAWFDCFLTKEDEIPYAEERRLFYVALTRTKNKVYLISPKKNPSIFIKEVSSYL